MKKLIAAMSIAFAGVASAAGPVVGLQYDFDRANGPGYTNGQEFRFSAAQETKFGTIDGALIGARYRGLVDKDDANGFEVGYGNKFAYRAYGLKARVGYGRMNQIDPNGGGFTGNSNYGVFSLEGSTAIAKQANAFVGYRHRNSFGDNMLTQNRYTVGVDYAFTPAIAARVGFAHTRQDGRAYNGVTTGVTYAF